MLWKETRGKIDNSVQSMRWMSLFCCTHFIELWVATLISRSTFILDMYLLLITATAEKPVSHKYEVANGSKNFIVFTHRSGYSFFTLPQNSGKDIVSKLPFKLELLDKSINCSSSIKERRSIEECWKGF